MARFSKIVALLTFLLVVVGAPAFEIANGHWPGAGMSSRPRGSRTGGAAHEIDSNEDDDQTDGYADAFSAPSRKPSISAKANARLSSVQLQAKFQARASSEVGLSSCCYRCCCCC